MTGTDGLERDYTLSRQAGWFERVDGPPRVAPIRYTRAELDALDGVERRRYDEQRAVWHANLGPILTPQMQSLLCELDEIVGSNRPGRRPGARRGGAVGTAGAGQDDRGRVLRGPLSPRAGPPLRRAHARGSPPGSGRLFGVDLEHDDAEPELGVVPVL